MKNEIVLFTDGDINLEVELEGICDVDQSKTRAPHAFLLKDLKYASSRCHMKCRISGDRVVDPILQNPFLFYFHISVCLIYC